MTRSRRELFIDMVIHMVILKNNQKKLFPCFTFISKTGDSVYCEAVLQVRFDEVR